MLGSTNAVAATETEIQIMSIFERVNLLSTSGVYKGVGPYYDNDYAAKDFLVIVSAETIDGVYFNYGDYYGPKNLNPHFRRNPYDYKYTAMIYVKCNPSQGEVHMWNYLTDEYIEQLYISGGNTIQLYSQSSHDSAYATTVCPPPIIKNYAIPNS